MILALLIPVAVPALIGGIQASRLLVQHERLNPSIGPYRDRIHSLNESVAALEHTMAAESTLRDWAAWHAVPRRDAPDEIPAPVATSADVRITYKLELHGILWHVGQPFAYINRTLAGLNDVVDGCTVTHIDRDSVIIVDPTGQAHRFNLDDTLHRQYPSYQPQ